MFPKLSGACYTIRLMARTSNINTLPSGHVETRDCYHIHLSAGLVHFLLQGYWQLNAGCLGLKLHINSLVITPYF